MKVIDFLKLSFQKDWAFNINWYRLVFGVVLPNNMPPEANPQGMPYLASNNVCVNIDGEQVRLDDAKYSQPLAAFSSRVIADSTWFGLIKEPVDISLGTLISNYLLIWKPFGGKIALSNPKVNVNKIDDEIAERMVTRPAPGKESPTDIYPDEHEYYKKIADWMRQIAPLISSAATYKVCVEPDNILENKRALLAEYKGQLHDPVKLTEFQDKLVALDREWLKGDPGEAFAKSSKVERSRIRLYLTGGAQSGFKDGETNVVVESLSEGWSRDPKTFAIMMNDARAGSYSRGTETIDGGVTAKVELRALNNYRIINTDCNSNLYHRRFIGKWNVKTLVGRTVVQNNSSKKIENLAEAADYLGKFVYIRSPRGCRLNGQRICSVCSGDRLASLPTGLTIPATEVSAEILTSSLKAMHGSKLVTVKIDPRIALSVKPN